MGEERIAQTLFAGKTVSTTYDRIGSDYGRNRREDPHLARMIVRELGGARSVVNVGAGTGSYEPRDRFVVAIEPSAVMLAQRPSTSAPANRDRRHAVSDMHR